MRGPAESSTVRCIHQRTSCWLIPTIQSLPHQPTFGMSGCLRLSANAPPYFFANSNSCSLSISIADFLVCVREGWGLRVKG